jgi:hypothetical protein
MLTRHGHKLDLRERARLAARLHAKSVSGGVFGELVLSSMVRVFIIRMGIHDHDDAEQADDGADHVPPVGAHRLLVG